MRRFTLCLFLVAACGSPDDPSIPGGADAGQSQQVKIVVRRDGVGRPGVRVYFQKPDSTLITFKDTDTNGEASAMMPDGGFVTAIDPFADPSGTLPTVELKTFAGVKPGDELLLEDVTGQYRARVTVTVPVDDTPDVYSYLISTPCDQVFVQDTSGTVDLHDDCQPTTDVLVASMDSTGKVLNYLHAPNQNVTTGALDLSSMTYSAATVKTYTYNNLPPANDAGVNIVQEIRSAAGPVVQLFAAAAGTPATTTLSLPVFSGASEMILGMIDYDHGVHGLMDFGPFEATYTTDVSARLLPAATSHPSYDVSTRRLTWTEGSSSQTPDFVIANVFAVRESESMIIEWTMSAPYSPGMVQFPSVPIEDGANYNFMGGDTIGVDQVVIGKLPGGYDKVRGALQTLSGPQDLAGADSGALTFQILSVGVKLRDARGSFGRFMPGSTGPREKPVARRGR